MFRGCRCHLCRDVPVWTNRSSLQLFGRKFEACLEYKYGLPVSELFFIVPPVPNHKGIRAVLLPTVVILQPELAPVVSRSTDALLGCASLEPEIPWASSLLLRMPSGRGTPDARLVACPISP